MDLVTRKKQTEEKLKKSFILKLLELCRTKTKKSSLDMFNFYIILNGLDMVTDVGRATTCRLSFEDPSLQTHCTRNEGPPQNMGFNMKTFEDLRRKKCSVDQTTAWDTRLLKTTIEDEPCNSDEINRVLKKKAFRLKLLELWKTRTEKPSPDMFNF